MSNAIIAETEHYHIVVGHSEEFNRDAYLLVNKETGVEELHELILPRVKQAMEQFEKFGYGEDDFDPLAIFDTNEESEPH